MSIIGDYYKQLHLTDVLKAAFRSAVAILMLFIVTTIGNWNASPDSFPNVDMVSLMATLKMAAITFLSSLVGSYYSNSKGQLFKKEPPHVTASVKPE